MVTVGWIKTINDNRGHGFDEGCFWLGPWGKKLKGTIR